MASSSAILTGPCAWASANCVNRTPTTRNVLTPCRRILFNRVCNFLALKGRLRFREFVAFTGKPHIKCGKQNDAHHQVGDQSSYDDDGEGPLRIGADGVRKSCRQKSEGGYQ